MAAYLRARVGRLGCLVCVLELRGAAALCANPSLVWKQASKTQFTSYPAPGSPECIMYSGCLYKGMFSACPSMKSMSWVMAHNIVAIHSKDFATYKLHDLCIKAPGYGSILVTVLDECADKDCSGCCTKNAQPSGNLIDVESFTDSRWSGTPGGTKDGQVQIADLGPTTGQGCQ